MCLITVVNHGHLRDVYTKHVIDVKVKVNGVVFCLKECRRGGRLPSLGHCEERI